MAEIVEKLVAALAQSNAVGRAPKPQRSGRHCHNDKLPHAENDAEEVKLSRPVNVSANRRPAMRFSLRGAVSSPYRHDEQPRRSGRGHDR